MLHRRKLHYQTPPLCKGAHEGRAQCAKQAVAVEAPEYRTSEAQAGTKTPVKQGASQVHFAHIGGPKGWSVEHTERSGVRRGNPSVSFADSSPYTGEPLGRRKARGRGRCETGGREAAGVSSTRSEAQCADTEHRAVMREAEGRLGPGNLEPKAAKRLECRAHGAKRSAQGQPLSQLR